MELSKRHLYFVLFCGAYGAAFWSPLRNLVRFALERDYGSHIVFVIPASIFLIYLKRREIFRDARSSFLLGSSVFVSAWLIGSATFSISRQNENYLSIQIIWLVALIWSAFLFCYGARAFRTAAFPLFFLLLLVPLPESLVQKIVSYLQHGSAEIADWLFRLARVPVFREGVMFHIPGLDLEVATECSGIRSSILLVITFLLVSYFALQSSWRRLVVVLAVIPVVILKNGVRIVTISLLTVYVNRGFLHGWLHSSGGVVFYLLGLATLLPIVNLLRKGEMKKQQTQRERAFQTNTHQSV